jgi:FeS assembly SUF system protein
MGTIINNLSSPELEEKIINMLHSIYDPEIPVDIYELGLMYEIHISETNDVKIVMTLTSPACPVAETLPEEVKQKIQGIEGVSSADIQITFEPTWTQEMMSEVAKVELGFM